MNDTIDLDRYFARIGYRGARAPTADVLRRLQLLHPQAISFENLDPFLARPVALDAGALQAKVLDAGRGGYCYEHNSIFYRVLRQLGFAVAGLQARVLMGRQEPVLPDRSHMLLKVEVNGESYIADVGFGSMTLSAPLRLDSEAPQQTPHGTFRLRRVEDEYEQQVLSEGRWFSLYRFSLAPQLLQDYLAVNWYRSTFPQSPFVQNVMVSRVLPDRRIGLFNDQFSVRPADNSRVERRTIGSAGELVDTLAGEFGIALPLPRADMERALQRVVSANAA